MNLKECAFECKRNRKRELLDEMSRVVSWTELVLLVVPQAPGPGAIYRRPPGGVVTMLRIHFQRQSVPLSASAMEKARRCTPRPCFVNLRAWMLEWTTRHTRDHPAQRRRLGDHGTGKNKHAGHHGRTPVSSNQAPVQAREWVLLQPADEYGTTHAVCAEQSICSAAHSVIGDAGLIVPEMAHRAIIRLEIALPTGQKAMRLPFD